MTDRPRIWAIPVAPGLIYDIRSTTGDPVEWVPVVEWDREKVEAAVTRALTELLDRKPESTTYGMARAIFDALDTSGGAR